MQERRFACSADQQRLEHGERKEGPNSPVTAMVEASAGLEAAVLEEAKTVG